MTEAGAASQPLIPYARERPAHPEGADALNRLAEAAALRTAQGLSLRFVDPRDDGLGYEERIWRQGEVETRRDCWHDYYNALAWLDFPRAKAALSARHAEQLAGRRDGGRGPVRDALTHFDECGLLVAAADPGLLALLREFRWRELFWERRAEVRTQMQFWLFGHATAEALHTPYFGLTAKAVLYEVEAAWLAQPQAVRRSDLDRRLAATLAAGFPATPADLQPLPLLGIPGLTPASESAAYYDDARQFRRGRLRSV